MARSKRALLAVAGGLVFPAALACNALVGLDDYEKVECTGLVCDGGAAPDVRPDDDGGVRPDVITRVDAAGTQPVSWAAWPMPNYDAGDGGDPNPLTYAPTTGGHQDQVTKLTWKEPADDGTHTFEQAQKKCTGEWRLPSRIELVTLIDNSRTGARIDPTFPSTQALAYWTFSEVRTVTAQGVVVTDQHWAVNFGTGGVEKLAPTAKGAVRCVKVGP